jgi:hypothetical protein
MKPKLIAATALAVGFGTWIGVMADPSKAYKPGAYGKVKDVPMFVCWREWDGEIRLGGVAKSLSSPWRLGDIGEYFAVEIQGASGCANYEQLLFGAGTTNIVLGTNYTGTIQLGTNFFKVSDLRKRDERSKI